SSDIFVRFGGEEFLVLMPETEVEGASIAAEKIRQAVEKNSHPLTGIQTVSLGVAERMPNELFIDWYKRVDKAMYAAKRLGRNRVVKSD
ncbi:MAG TPA: diguanylate cyclase, partial [Clostridiales bacterium UBA8960]|nr:diguanylate cyclase [Clostridiales bacterium UBA8960]